MVQQFVGEFYFFTICKRQLHSKVGLHPKSLTFEDVDRVAKRADKKTVNRWEIRKDLGRR